MYRGFSSIPFETFFELDDDSRTRGHTAKLKTHKMQHRIKKAFLFGAYHQ